MGMLKACLRPAVHLAREAVVLSNLVAQTGQGPLVAFLPAYGRHGAALLRIYNVAEALRQRGWRVLVLPPTLTLAQRHRALARARPDAVVMQGARHDLNRPALYPGYRIVFDMDDADFHLPHLEARVRAAMDRVAFVIAGSAYVADWCRAAGATAHVVWTGTPVSRGMRPPQADRPPVVAWAQTRPETYVREAEFVLEVMQRLVRHRPEARLRLYGYEDQDRAFLERFQAAGIATEWLKSCKYSDYLRSFDDVSLGLAPLCPETPFSRGKSFGKVLAYLDAQVPVLATDACEHGRFFAADAPALPNDPDLWADVAARLLGDAALRQEIAEADFQRFQARLSLEAAACRVDNLLRDLLAGSEPFAAAG